MAEDKKARARGTKRGEARKAPTHVSTRRAKAATAKTSETKASETKVGETRAQEVKAAPAKAPETARPAPVQTATPALAQPKAAQAPKADPLMNAVEAIKASATRAAEPAKAAAQSAPVPVAPVAVAEAAKAFVPAAASARAAAVPAAHLVEAGTRQVREAVTRVQASSEQFRNVVTEATQASTRGALEVNDKVIDALRAQSDAALDLWRATVTAGSFSEAVHAQSTGARQVYETTASHWRDVAETTTRWLGETVKPFQSAWTRPGRSG